MENRDIAAIFHRIAELLELKDENPFRVRSYRLAADTIADYPTPLTEIAVAGISALQQIPGIGRTISSTILELINTGTATVYEQIKSEVPESTLELLEINGLGLKTVQRLYREYQITSIDQLEAFALSGKLETIGGLRKKSIDKILRSIEQLKERRALMLLLEAYRLYQSLTLQLAKIESISSIDMVGAARRGQEMLPRLEILLVVTDPISVHAALRQLPGIITIEAETESRIDLIFAPNLAVSFILTIARNKVVSLVRTTSTTTHFESLQQLAATHHLNLTESGLYQIIAEQSSDLIELVDEQDFYRKLNLPLIASEQRELAVSQIDLNIQSRLIDENDLCGDLHMHTIASDGANTILEMVAAARSCGLEYIAITDHTKSSTIANGLDEKRLLQQLREIDQINAQLSDFRVLKGSEVDILSDGYLDLSEEILSQLDFVVASIHSGFAQSRERVTSRVIKAIESGRVNVFAHPTGRLVGRRPGYEIDLEQVYIAARAHNVCLELNANPHRLDLSADNLREARAQGVRFIISTDSHSIRGFQDRHFGIVTARRAGLTPEDVLNTLPLNQFLPHLKGSKTMTNAG